MAKQTPTLGPSDLRRLKGMKIQRCRGCGAAFLDHPLDEPLCSDCRLLKNRAGRCIVCSPPSSAPDWKPTTCDACKTRRNG